MLTIGSLFSGIGGFEQGLEWSGLGHTVWQVEQNEFCRKRLKRHWPNADRSVTDVREAGSATLPRVDLICGGFPCQDVSSAGKGAGLAGSRSGLWFEFSRIVEEIQPTWVLVENVTSGARRWVDAVLSDLEQLDYEALPVSLSACDVGAPQRRARVFIVANSNGRRCETERIRTEITCRSSEREGDLPAYGHDINGRSGAWPWPPGPGDIDAWRGYVAAGGPEPAIRRGSDGLFAGMDLDAWKRQLTMLGNAVVPQCAEVIGWMIRETISPS